MDTLPKELLSIISIIEKDIEVYINMKYINKKCHEACKNNKVTVNSFKFCGDEKIHNRIFKHLYKIKYLEADDGSIVSDLAYKSMINFLFAWNILNRNIYIEPLFSRCNDSGICTVIYLNSEYEIICELDKNGMCSTDNLDYLEYEIRKQYPEKIFDFTKNPTSHDFKEFINEGYKFMKYFFWIN